MKSILDKSFAYTNAAATDIRKTFRRVRREQEAAKAAAAASNVKAIVPITQRKKGPQ